MLIINIHCICIIQLSQCEEACQSLEVELADHRKKWEESMMTAEQHRAIIDQLTAKQAGLEEEVTKREERVAELEALLAEVQSCNSVLKYRSHDCMYMYNNHVN